MKVKGSAGYPANLVTCSPRAATKLAFPKGALARIATVRPMQEGEDPLNAVSPHVEILPSFDLPPEPAPTPTNPTPARRKADILAVDPVGPTAIPPGTTLWVHPVLVTKGGAPVVEGGRPVLSAIRFEFIEDAEVTLGDEVPNAPVNKTWLRPFGPMTSKYGHPLLYTYSLIIALICGTAGLPHILVRFYTNPDGRAAKRTTLWVMVMLGSFYVFPPAWGAIGRHVLPTLYANNTTDAVVIRLPAVLASPLWGQVLVGITSAGAFAAFMSTFSGLLVSMSGALAHDIYGKILFPRSSPRSRLVAFKVAAVLIGAISMGLGFLVESFDIAMMVGWAFAIAACSYFPLLLLGAWWRPLTVAGAAGGMLLGGTSSLVAIVTSMLLDKKVLTFPTTPLVRSLLEQPAIWGVPLSVTTMIVVSLLTPHLIPRDIHLKMLRLHAPEELGLSRNYIEH